MPVFRQRIATDLASNIKAFLNLEAGVVRGGVPNTGEASGKLRKQLNQRSSQLKQTRQRLSARNRKIKVLRERHKNIELIREQLNTNAREIGRLAALVNTLQGENRQLRDGGARPEVSTNPETNGPSAVSGGLANKLYLDLIKKSLKHEIYDEPQVEDSIWPSTAHTMIGFDSLDRLQSCIEDVLANDVPGDFIETGVWRGGTCIFMRAMLKSHGVTDRSVWVADSFEGLPPPNAEKYPHDAGDISHTAEELAIPLEEVKSNFERYGLLDDQVHFLKGFFSDTLPDAPIEKLAVARLDGDMYESTMDALTSLYPKLSVGGYLIVDDYGAVPACRQAVHDYREANGIEEEIHSIDWTGVYWRRAT